MQIYDAFPELKRDLKFHPLGNKDLKILSADQIRTYNKKGFLFPISVFNNLKMQNIKYYFDDLLKKSIAAGWNSYEIINWHKHCNGIYEIVSNSNLIDIIEDLLGENIVLRHSHFFVKLPGDGKRVSWHQDMSYWPLSKCRVVTAWLAIDDTDYENAAMQVIPGSHLRPNIPFVDSHPSENNVLNQTVVNAENYGEKPVTLELKSGQISLHSDLTLHSSEVNKSNRRRCGLAMRFLSPDVKAYKGWNKNSIICRGKDITNHWANNPKPSDEFIPQKNNETVDVTMKNLGLEPN